MIKNYYPWRANILFLLPLLAFIIALHIYLGSEDDISEFFSAFRKLHPQLTTVMSLFTNYGNIIFYPIYLFVLIKAIKERNSGSITFIVSWLFAQLIIILGLGYFLKIAIGRPRPHVDGPFTPFVRDSRHNSFPSGHTAEAIINALPLALYFKNTALYIILPLMPLLMAFTRIYLGAHYSSDIVGSLFLGSLASYVTWRVKLFLDEKIKNRRECGSSKE